MTWTAVINSPRTLGNNGGVTVEVDTRTCDLLIIGIASAQNNTTFTDSAGNTWSTHTVYGSTAPRVFLKYVVPGAKVSATHTFSYTVTNSYSRLWILGLSGASATPTDQETGATSGGGTPTELPTGAITPSEDGTLVVSCLGTNSDVTGVGVTALGNLVTLGGGAQHGISGAYLDQTSAAAINPTWSWTNAQRASACIASFKLAAGAATTFYTPLTIYSGGKTPLVILPTGKTPLTIR